MYHAINTIMYDESLHYIFTWDSTNNTVAMGLILITINKPQCLKL